MPEKTDNSYYSGRFSAFRYKNFRLYWIGHFLSLTGTWVQQAAQGWLVLRLTDSAFFLGVVGAAASLPILLFTVFGGVLADRFRKRSLLLFTQGISILPAVFLGFLTMLDRIEVWQVITLVALLGTVNSLDIPVRQSFLIDLVSPRTLHHAIALNAAAFNGARMLGPAIAGFVISWVGMHFCFWLNAVSFGASLFVLFRIRPSEVSPSVEDETRSMFTRMREGFAYLRSDRTIFSLLLMVTTLSLVGLPYATQMPVFARDILHLDSGGYGILMSSIGMGALGGALYLSFRVTSASPRTVHLGGAFFAISMILFSRSVWMYPSMVLLFVTGFSAVVLIASINISIQRRVPDQLRGRVMSIYTTLFLGMFPIGSLIVGTSSYFIGVQSAVTVNGILCLAAVTYSGIHQRRLRSEGLFAGTRSDRGRLEQGPPLP